MSADKHEWDLLARSAQGDSQAFTEIVQAHERRLYRLCLSMLGHPGEAEEAVQETFLKLFRKASTFSPRGQLFTLLYRMASNHCLNVLRRRKIAQFLPWPTDAGSTDEAPALDPVDPHPDPHRQLGDRAAWEETSKALAALPPAQRAVVVLVKLEGLSYREAAETLEVSVGAVESRLFRAMRTLAAVRGGGDE